MTNFPSHLLSRASYYGVMLLLVAVVVALHLAGKPLLLLFGYEYLAVRDGEFWRLLTGHLLHLNTAHLVMNLAGLLIIWLLFVDSNQPVWIWISVLFIAALGVGLSLYLLNPEVRGYVGLSGVLHGLLAAALFLQLTQVRSPEMVLLILVAAKVLGEQLFGPFGSDKLLGAPVITVAHLYGTVWGLAAATGIRSISRLRSMRKPGHS